MANVYAAQQSAGQKKKQLSPKTKQLIIWLTSAGCALLAFILIFSLVNVKVYSGMAQGGFKNPDIITISGTQNGARIEQGKDSSGEERQRYDKILSKFKAGSFSFMRGWLEGKFDTSLSISMKKDNDDEPDQVTNAISASAINSLPNNASAENKNFYVEFIYRDYRTVSINGTKIKYDRVGFFIDSKENKINKLQLYFYDSDMVARDIGGLLGQFELPYETYVTKMQFNANPLFVYLDEKLVNPKD